MEKRDFEIERSDATRMPPPIVLTIAGFDPSSGAGITADLKTFAAHGLYGVSCATALTVQSTSGVKRVVAVDHDVVSETLACLAEDLPIAGVKIGMLATAPVTAAVAQFLERSGLARERTLLDPVLRSSSGAVLLEENGLRTMRERLLPRVGWVTPNVEELSVLLGSSAREGQNRSELADQALLLRKQGKAAGNLDLQVVVTGGHLDRPDDFYTGPANEGIWIEGVRVETNATHGTGCAFSSALLAALVAGSGPLEAVKQAKRFVTEAMRQSYPLGHGKGPMHHLFQLGPRSS